MSKGGIQIFNDRSNDDAFGSLSPSGTHPIAITFIIIVIKIIILLNGVNRYRAEVGMGDHLPSTH